MEKQTKENKVFQVNNPIEFAWRQLGGQAAEWMAEHPQVNAVLVFRDAVNAIDLQTRDRFVEVRADLVPHGTGAIQQRKILKRFYSTLRVKESAVKESNGPSTRVEAPSGRLVTP